MAQADLIALLADLASASPDKEDPDKVHRLRNLIIRSVHLVDRGANRRTFAVRKRGEAMQTSDNLFGPEVTPGGEGDLLFVDKADTIPGPVKQAVMRALTEASERTMSLINRLKQAKEGEGGLASDFITELKGIGQIVAGVWEKYPSPRQASKEDEDDDAKKAQHEDEDEDMKKAKAKDEDEDMKKAKAKDEDEDVEKAKAKDEDEDMKKAKAKEEDEEKRKAKDDEEDMKKAKAKEEDEEKRIVKAGRKMSKSNLQKFKTALDTLINLAKELDDDDQKKVKDAFKFVQKALERPEPEPAKAPSSNASPEPKTEVAKRDDGRINWGININDPEYYKKTADPDTSFFD